MRKSKVTPVYSCTGNLVNAASFVRKSHPTSEKFNWCHYSDVSIGGADWSIFFIINRDALPWVNVKFATTKKMRSKKQCFWIGYNGQRMAFGKDAKIASEHEPALIEWLKREHEALLKIKERDADIEV